MNIAFIRRMYSPCGGAELYLQRLIEALLADGHKIHLYTEKWEGLPDKVNVHTIKTFGAKYKRILQFSEDTVALVSQNDHDCVFSLEKTFKQDIYRAGDGVHKHWLKLWKKYSPWWKKPFIGIRLFHHMTLFLESQTLNPQNTGLIIVNSEMVSREIQQYYFFPRDRIYLVRNGVNIERFSNVNRDAARKRFGLNPDDFVLLFVGSGWERKGLQFLLKLMSWFEKLSDDEIKKHFHLNGISVKPENIKLLVVGKGRKPLFVPKNVVFAGVVRDVENAYAAADLFVFLPIYDPSANVVFEALVSKLPVITSLTNGASEVIRQNINGTVVKEPSDIDEIRKAVLYWIKNGGRKGFNNVQACDLSIQRNVSETMEIIKKAFNAKVKLKL